jgi:hypothetical protein
VDFKAMQNEHLLLPESEFRMVTSSRNCGNLLDLLFAADPGKYAD